MDYTNKACALFQMSNPAPHLLPSFLKLAMPTSMPGNHDEMERRMEQMSRKDDEGYDQDDVKAAARYFQTMVRPEDDGESEPSEDLFEWQQKRDRIFNALYSCFVNNQQDEALDDFIEQFKANTGMEGLASPPDGGATFDTQTPPESENAQPGSQEYSLPDENDDDDGNAPE